MLSCPAQCIRLTNLKYGWLSCAALYPTSLTPHPAHKHFICKIFAYPAMSWLDEWVYCSPPIWGRLYYH